MKLPQAWHKQWLRHWVSASDMQNLSSPGLERISMVMVIPMKDLEFETVMEKEMALGMHLRC
jgi:hypothetical protein